MTGEGGADGALATLEEYARAEHATRQELAEVRAVLVDWGRVDPQDATRRSWEEREAQLQRRLNDQEAETAACAHSLGLLVGEQTPQVLAAQARLRAARPRARPSAAESLRRASCPVKGCGTTVRAATGTSCQPRELPIDPTRADQPYTCPCGRRALLTVGRTVRKGWVLREFVPDRDAREEMNLIAHALVTGQAYRERRRERPTDTSPDPASARMVQAFQASRHHALQAVRLLLAGHVQAARDVAERANAADYAYQLHARSVRRNRREEVRSGRWHNAGTFWVDLPARPTRPGPSRHTFDFVAVWDERGAKLEVANAEDIERESGIEAGADAWRQLIALLTRFEDKPGTKTDPRELIYQQKGDKLILREHIRSRFPRAVIALEALRQTLRRADPGGKKPVGDPLGWLGHVPDWVQDVVIDAYVREEDLGERVVGTLAVQLFSD